MTKTYAAKRVLAPHDEEVVGGEWSNIYRELLEVDKLYKKSVIFHIHESDPEKGKRYTVINSDTRRILREEFG